MLKKLSIAACLVAAASGAAKADYVNSELFDGAIVIHDPQLCAARIDEEMKARCKYALDPIKCYRASDVTYKALLQLHDPLWPSICRRFYSSR